MSPPWSITNTPTTTAQMSYQSVHSGKECRLFRQETFLKWHWLDTVSVVQCFTNLVQSSQWRDVVSLTEQQHRKLMSKVSCAPFRLSEREWFPNSSNPSVEGVDVFWAVNLDYYISVSDQYNLTVGVQASTCNLSKALTRTECKRKCHELTL